MTGYGHGEFPRIVETVYIYLALGSGFLGICILELYSQVMHFTNTTHILLITIQQCIFCFVSERVLTMTLLVSGRVPVFIVYSYMKILKQQILPHVSVLIMEVSP